VNFDFIEKLAVKVSPEQIDNYVELLADRHAAGELLEYGPWSTLYPRRSEKIRFDSREFNRMFRQEVDGKSLSDEDLRNGVTLIRYDKSQRARHLHRLNPIYLLVSDRAAQTVNYIRDHARLRGFVKFFQIIDSSSDRHPTRNTIVLELHDDPVMLDEFGYFLRDETPILDSMGLVKVDRCTPNTCLDVRVPDVNVLPLLMQANTLRVDAMFEAGKEPDSFELKGFMEIEVRVASPI
jgi:hypothetical protein